MPQMSSAAPIVAQQPKPATTPSVPGNFGFYFWFWFNVFDFVFFKIKPRLAPLHLLQLVCHVEYSFCLLIVNWFVFGFVAAALIDDEDETDSSGTGKGSINFLKHSLT